MGERIVRSLDLKTGDVTEQRTTTEGDSDDLAERVRDLTAIATERLGEPALTQTMALLCDGCGVRITLEQPELPPGWTSTPSGDFCPECVL